MGAGQLRGPVREVTQCVACACQLECMGSRHVVQLRMIDVVIEVDTMTMC